ncbi:DUF6082 family protein [Actinoplanes sp. NPDC048791]|uniref:DUF6082 family protein n=1 Tax=Actinoplanes sp. NPDC048791 TaxID=3154623 RepID=UPI0033C5CA1A
MSNVGQAYGFASAIISAAALFAVARSFSMQVKQSRAAEIQALRSMHVEVARLSFEYPDVVAPAWGRSPDDREYLRDVWRTLVLQYALAGYELGETPESNLRQEFARGLFSTAEGRAWWGDTRLASGQFSERSRKTRIAVSILEDELRRIESRLSSSGDPRDVEGDGPSPSA